MLKAVGIDVGVNTKAAASSQDKSLIEQAKNSNLSDQFSDALNKGWQKVIDHKGSITDQAQKQALESIQGNFQKAKTFSDQAQASLTESENYRKAASFVKSSGGNIVSNLNDEVLDYIGARKGMTREEVAHWQSSHKSEYDAEASQFLAERLQPFMDQLKSSHPMNEGQIREAANNYFAKTPSTVDRSDIGFTKGIGEQNDVGVSNSQRMDRKVSVLRGDTSQSFKEHEEKLSSGKSSVDQEHQGLERAYNTRKDEGIFMPVANKMPVVGSIGNEISKPEDFGTPTSTYYNLKKPSSGHQGDMQPSTYVRSMEDSVKQSRAANRIASQGRQIKQLKDSIEMNKDTSQEEVPLEMNSSQKIER